MLPPRPQSLTAALVLALALTACPSAPVTPAGPGPVDRRALTTPPAVVPLDPATRRFMFDRPEDLTNPDTARLAQAERNLWAALVLPLKPARAEDADDVHRGLALGDVLTRMLAVKSRDEAFFEARFTLDVSAAVSGVTGVLGKADLFTAPNEPTTWLGTPGNALPSGLARTDVRWLVGGQLLPAAKRGGARRVFLWLMDRVDAKVWSGTTEIDLPRVAKPRLLLLSLITDAGLAPEETERGDMLWTEDLDDAGLVAVGRAIVASVWDDEAHRPIVDAVTQAAPWSYTAWLLYAHAHSNQLRDCDPTVRAALNRALSLNPHADFMTAADTLGCQLGGLLEAEPGTEDLLYEAMSRSGTTSCGVAGKAIASVGGGREVPGSGFLAGLGGVYRNSTCKSEGAWALADLARRSMDPFVAAGLFLDAGVAGIADNTLNDAEAAFEDAIASIEKLPAPRACLPELYIAEAHLHLAGLSLQRGVAQDGRARIAEAERIGTTCKDERLVARAWNTLGLVEQASGQYARALAAFKRAHDVFVRVGDDMNVAVTLSNLGWTRALIGQPKKALPDLERALAGKRRVRSAGGVAVALENLGVTLMTLGRFAEAEPLFVEARELTSDPTSRAAILNNLARIRAGQGRHDDAQALLGEARALAVQAHARTLEAQIEQTKGGLEAESKRYREALATFNQALVIRREVGDRAGEGLTLSSLMTVAARMERRALAIVYGKLAIAAHQEVKAATKAIDKEAEAAFLKSREATYRQLADLLVKESRLVEAERVLSLLKQDEADDWTRSVESASGTVPLTPAEKALERDYGKVADKVMAVGHAYGQLAAKYPLTAAEQKQLDGLRKQLEAANAHFGKFLASLADKPIESRGLEDLREGTGIGADLAELGPGTVAVYTLVGKDDYHAIVVSADAQVAASVRIGQANLNAMIASLRQALQDPRSDPRPLAKELWDVLVAPIAEHLDQAGAKTVLWSLDRSLRYLPLGALYDGERWLVERWPTAVFTPASRARLKDEPRADWRVLAAGVSQGKEGFAPLPAVKDELAAIVDDADTKEVDGVLPGVVMLDDAFARDAFLGLLGRKWPVVHIASHFAFEPGDKDASYLLLGQGRLSVSELENMPNLFQGVDLLSLSACNTATGDAEGAVGKEVESFAVLAQRKGARAVLASLWPVADRSTSALMRRFYTLHRDGGTTKLAALRQAQLDLIAGTIKSEPSDVRGPRPLSADDTPETGATPAAPEALVQADWSHPYYWAPFVLIGNTR